jgi:hypothetical protein
MTEVSHGPVEWVQCGNSEEKRAEDEGVLHCAADNPVEEDNRHGLFSVEGDRFRVPYSQHDHTKDMDEEVCAQKDPEVCPHAGEVICEFKSEAPE